MDFRPNITPTEVIKKEALMVNGTEEHGNNLMC